MNTTKQPGADAGTLNADFELSAARFRLIQARRPGLTLETRLQMLEQAAQHVDSAHAAMFPKAPRLPGGALGADGAEYMRGR